jgi:hypothetical protein
MINDVEQPAPGTRWPILREKTATRELSRWVWWAVAARDEWACRICHTTEPADGWEIDHVVPWSAGGSNQTTNLRLACRPCNQQRSNYADPFARNMPPIIDKCQPDYGVEWCGVRVWCARHRVWESAPAAYAEQYELTRRLREKK